MAETLTDKTGAHRPNTQLFSGDPTMRRLAPSLILITGVSGCGTPDTSEETVQIYKPLGSVQCGGGEIKPPEVMRIELLDANIPVRNLACGKDGLFHPAVCGEPDGLINIFTIPQTKEAKALSLGFRLLSSLSNATQSPCEG